MILMPFDMHGLLAYRPTWALAIQGCRNPTWALIQEWALSIRMTKISTWALTWEWALTREWALAWVTVVVQNLKLGCEIDRFGFLQGNRVLLVQWCLVLGFRDQTCDSSCGKSKQISIIVGIRIREQISSVAVCTALWINKIDDRVHYASLHCCQYSECGFHGKVARFRNHTLKPNAIPLISTIY